MSLHDFTEKTMAEGVLSTLGKIGSGNRGDNVRNISEIGFRSRSAGRWMLAVGIWRGGDGVD